MNGIYYRSLLWLTAIIIFGMTGCTTIDPSYLGDVSSDPSMDWLPVCTIKTPIYTNRVEIPDHPLSPCELVDIAMRTNPLTRQSWNLARAAAFNVGVSESALYPTITAQETLSFEDTSRGQGAIAGSSVDPVNNNDPFNPNDQTNFGETLPGYNQIVTHELMISYLLLDFGGRNAEIEASRQALNVSNWTHNRVLQDVILATLQAYYSYNNAMGLFISNEENFRDAKTVLEAAKQQFEVGVTTVLDVLRTSSNYVNTELQLEAARGQVNTTLGQLAKAIGVPANTQLSVAPLPDKLPVEDIANHMDTLIEIALEYRPDLSAAFSNYRQQEARVYAARSEGMPTLTANIDLQQTNFIHNPSFNNHAYVGNIALNIPIFAGFLYRNLTNNAKANAAAAFAAWQDKEANVLLDVVTSYNRYLTAVESLKYSDEFLKFSQQAYEATLMGYREGVSSILDLITAQITLANARAQKVQSRTELMSSAAGIAYATGTL